MSSNEEFNRAATRITFTDLEKSMTSFNGDDAYGIETWIKEFEDIASLMEWNNLEKLIYSKQLISGTARLFLRSLQDVTKWENVKEELRAEFGSNLNSAALHKRLASRKVKGNETYQQYFLHMKEIALLGSIEDEALMEYVIDGIRDTEFNKSILYGATNMKEFKKKLKLYSEIRRKTDLKAQNSNSKPPTTPGTAGQRQKLRPKYLGPYEVIKVKKNHRYDLRKVGSGDGPNNTSSTAKKMLMIDRCPGLRVKILRIHQRQMNKKDGCVEILV